LCQSEEWTFGMSAHRTRAPKYESRFVRNVRDAKSGKRRDTFARLSWRSACELGFRGNLGEWERLMDAVPAALRGADRKDAATPPRARL